MKYPAATWIGAAPQNWQPFNIAPKFIVEHVMQGSLTGTDHWFQNPNAQVSAHFGIGKDGSVHQYVDTAFMAYAEMAWNDKAISIEHEGNSGDSLTSAQIDAEVLLWEWIKNTHHVRLVWTDNPNDPAGGVISHGLLGVAGGNHPQCPGAPIVENVKARLAALVPPVPVPPTPKPPTPTPPTIAVGSHGGLVVELQRLLHVKADGAYGPQTFAAVEHFQREHHLHIDGICGPETWKALGK